MQSITPDQALALAPDAASASAGKKQSDIRHWRGLGRNERALWGECQGSALYQTQVDMEGMAAKCTCPSRKFPCKHGIGLLLLYATQPDALTPAEPPERVATWLAKRDAAATKAAATADATATDATSTDAMKAPVRNDAAAPGARRAEKRERLVREGIESLDLWMDDLIRVGLGQPAVQTNAFWERQAARLVDAQASGLANRLRRISEVVGAGEGWPEHALAGLGRVALLTEAYRRLDSLDAPLVDDVRQLIGWSLSSEEVLARGDRVTDRWTTLGQWIDDGDRVRTLRAWLLGARTGRFAMVMQFSVGSQAFPETYLPGLQFDAELCYWPSAYPTRARIVERFGAPALQSAPIACGEDIAALLARYASALAAQPWLDRVGAALRAVTPLPPDGADGLDWRVLDASGATLPLLGDDHWRLLAIAGGSPVDLYGEWNGEALLPLGVFAEGRYTPLWGGL